MPKYPHTHEWKYNEAIQMFSEEIGPHWQVFRFCLGCLESEIVNLGSVKKE